MRRKVGEKEEGGMKRWTEGEEERKYHSQYHR